MKSLIVFLLLTNIFNYAIANETISGQLIKNLQSNQFEGRQLGLLRDDGTVFVLKTKALPKRLVKSLNYTRGQEIEVTGTIVENETENFEDKIIHANNIAIIQNSEIEASEIYSGVLTRHATDEFKYSIKSNNDFVFNFIPATRSMHRILNNYLDQIVQISGGKNPNDDYYYESCEWEDEYDDYVNDIGDVCDPEETERKKIQNTFILRSLTPPTESGSIKGKIHRAWETSRYKYFVSPIDDQAEAQRQEVWVGGEMEKVFLEKYNGENVTISGPIFQFKGSRMIHAESIQIIEQQ